MTAASPANEAALIELRDVVKTFKTPAGEVTVLKGIHLDFKGGEFTGIVGKSGSGKSTLINMITGIDHPTGGRVIIGGTSLHTLAEGRLAVWRGRMLGVVFQFFQLLPMLTVRENVLLPMDLAGIIPYEKREQRAMDLLKQVGASDLAEKLPGVLSGGQQQTAAIARALANDPPILVADEPTGNLDSTTAETIFLIFQELTNRGKTIIMVTHDMSLANRANRKVILCDGEVINEHLAGVFPELTHPQLLALTHSLTSLSVSAGQLQNSLELLASGLLMVTGGQLQIELPSAYYGGVRAELLSAGQYLCMPPLSGEDTFQPLALKSIAGEVNLLLIPRDTMEEWMAANPTGRETLIKNSENSRILPSAASSCPHRGESI